LAYFVEVLGAIAQWLEQRTHNPLVPGSSPGCPTFSTIPLQQSFRLCASVTHSRFYANFTQLTELNWHQPAQIHLPSFPLSNPFLSTSIPLIFFAEIYQVFLQVRKKCVNLCLYNAHTIVCKWFVYQLQRIINQLFSNVPFCYKIFYLMRCCCG
jgi:hypothetical protein